MSEKFDLYDASKNKLGRTHVRGLPLGKNEYHLVVEVWVINSDNKILVTQRHPEKNWGSYWECPGGAVIAGEESLDGAKRELFEETGISVFEKDLIYLGSQQYIDWFTDSFIVKADIDLSDLVLQDGEVVNAKWVNHSEFENMSDQKLIVPFTAERFYLYKDSLKY